MIKIDKLQLNALTIATSRNIIAYESSGISLDITESGDGIKLGETIDARREKIRGEKRFEVMVQQSCIRTNCYEHVDTDMQLSHISHGQSMEKRKEEHNGVVTSPTRKYALKFSPTPTRKSFSTSIKIRTFDTRKTMLSFSLLFTWSAMHLEIMIN